MFLGAGDVQALTERALGSVVSLGLEVGCRCARHGAGGTGCAGAPLSPASRQPWPQAGTGLGPRSDLLLKYSAGVAIEPKQKLIQNFLQFLTGNMAILHNNNNCHN